MVARLATISAAMVGAALVLAACPGSGDGGVARSSAEPGGDLLARLRDGGLTIVMRHAQTDRSQPDASTVDLNDCATQRNLSAQGRADARAVGAAVDRLDIPVGEVWASPYCRSMDTAELAFGRFEVTHGLERLYPERDEDADSRLNQRIRERAPRAGEPHLMIAGHGVYPSVLAPAVTLGEGEAALYARAGGGFELVGRIEPDEWAHLGAGQEQFGAGVARVVDSVVSVDGPGGPGTAFRVAVPGMLVTSGRLVGNAGEVTVVPPRGDGLTAHVLGRNREVDIAVLRVTHDSGLPPLHSGSGLADAQVGDRAFAVGASGTVTTGPLSALREPVTMDGGGQVTAIHLDAKVPRASVGGPLVTEDGYVLGVLTMATDAGGGVAIPVDVARDAALEIVRGD